MHCNHCCQHSNTPPPPNAAITPHLDDGLYAGQWRNAMAINPLARYDGRMSYAEIMLLPLADALSAVITADMRVWFALQGCVLRPGTALRLHACMRASIRAPR